MDGKLVKKWAGRMRDKGCGKREVKVTCYPWRIK